MSEDKVISSFERGIHYSITYTCSTPGCVYDGIQNYEVVTFVDVEDIVETMQSTVCGGNM